MTQIKESASVHLNVSQAQELKILREIVNITNSQLELSAILGEIVKIVTKATKADSVFIYLFDDHRENLVLMASKTPHKKELGKVLLKAGEGITGWVAQENEWVSISKGAYLDKRFKSFDVLPEDKYEAILSIPIRRDSKVIGVINIQHQTSHEYSEATTNLMAMIAKQVAGVIDFARLYEESRQKALQFDSLMKVSQSVTSQEYLDDILDLIVVTTAEMLDSKICSIMLLDASRRELAIKATQSLSDEYRKKANISVDNSISGEVVKSKKAMTIANVQKEERYRFRDLAVKEGLTSMLSVPMIFKDQAIGIVNVYTKEPHRFSEDEIDALQIVANQAAVAVEHTKVVEESMKAKEALETRKLVERAKGILMKMQGIDEDKAYKLIHKKSMDSCRSMKDIAESVILMEELQKK